MSNAVFFRQRSMVKLFSVQNASGQTANQRINRHRHRQQTRQ